MTKHITKRLALSFETIRHLDAVVGGVALGSSPKPVPQDTLNREPHRGSSALKPHKISDICTAAKPL